MPHIGLNSARFTWVICFLGSAVRLVYATVLTPWKAAPDHLAWEAILGEVITNPGNLQYDQLIHYPHEGGTIMVSALSLLFKFFASNTSLVISAFVLDFFSRFLQIWIVKRLFSKSVFVFFSVWTIFSIPALLPWASVNFGLHAVSAVFPFLFLLLLKNVSGNPKSQMKAGLSLALMVWFSYSNVVLPVVYIVLLLLEQNRWKKVGGLLVGFTPVLLVHLLVRRYTDAGFHLSRFGLDSLRGLEILPNSFSVLSRFIWVWVKPLPGSSLLPEMLSIPNYIIRWIWFGLIAIGMAMAVVKRDWLKNRLLVASMALVAGFLVLYCLGPFYADSLKSTNYVSYRHLAYILPLLILISFTGLLAHKRGKWVAISFILLSSSGSLLSFANQPSNEPSVQQMGWVLGVKFGHEPERLSALAYNSTYSQPELLTGFGWGICSTVLEGKNPEEAERELTLLSSIAHKFPCDQRAFVLSGYKIAFDPKFTPILAPDLYPMVQDMSEKIKCL